MVEVTNISNPVYAEMSGFRHLSCLKGKMVLGQHRRVVGNILQPYRCGTCTNELLAAGFPIDQISYKDGRP